MTQQERTEINDKIQLLIGTKEDVRRLSKSNNEQTSDTINKCYEYDKMYIKLFKIAEKYGHEKLSFQAVDQYGRVRFVTLTGKLAIWERNNGWTTRSRYCGDLRIDGKTIFTSGTIAKVMEYVLNN